MDVAFFGHGKVADRCKAILIDKGFNLVEPDAADLWISVHYPRKFTKAPLGGILNLHNSFLPWNRGAHPCTWAIIDHTPHGATLHWVDQGLDTGPIFLQDSIEILPNDTADTLYHRTADLEVDVFRHAMEILKRGVRLKQSQPTGGSFHTKADFERLKRALTTSDCKVVHEA